MNLWLRCLWVILSGLFKRRLGVLDYSVLHFCVLPNDLDLYAHMNNGRYLTIMDLGRIDLILRSSLGQEMRQNRWNPLVGSTLMRYRRSLKLFAAYELKTRILCWDEKWFYLEQRFEQEGNLIAEGLVKGLFVGPDGIVPAPQVLKKSGFFDPPPEIPAKILQWIQADRTPL